MKAPASAVLPSALDLSERAAFMVDCLDLPAATGVDDAQWERFQLDYLADDGPFRVEIKSR